MLTFEPADWMFFRTFIKVCLYQGGERMYGSIMAASPHWYNQLRSTRLMGRNLLFPDINSNQQSKCPTIHDLVKTHLDQSIKHTAHFFVLGLISFFFSQKEPGTGRVKKIKHRLRGTNEKEECHFFWGKENIPPVH